MRGSRKVGLRCPSDGPDSASNERGDCSPQGLSRCIDAKIPPPGCGCRHELFRRFPANRTPVWIPCRQTPDYHAAIGWSYTCRGRARMRTTLPGLTPVPLNDSTRNLWNAALRSCGASLQSGRSLASRSSPICCTTAGPPRIATPRPLSSSAASTRKYGLGARVADVALSAISSVPLHQGARPLLEELRLQANYTVCLGVLLDDTVLCLDVLHGTRAHTWRGCP